MLEYESRFLGLGVALGKVRGLQAGIGRQKPCPEQLVWVGLFSSCVLSLFLCQWNWLQMALLSKPYSERIQIFKDKQDTGKANRRSRLVGSALALLSQSCPVAQSPWSKQRTSLLRKSKKGEMCSSWALKYGSELDKSSSWQRGPKVEGMTAEERRKWSVLPGKKWYQR